MTEQQWIVELVKSGGLTSIIIVLLFVVKKLYADLQEEREKHRTELAAQETECEKKCNAWEERYRTKTETMESRNHEVTKGLATVLERLEKKFSRTKQER